MPFIIFKKTKTKFDILYDLWYNHYILRKQRR